MSSFCDQTVQYNLQGLPDSKKRYEYKKVNRTCFAIYNTVQTQQMKVLNQTSQDYETINLSNLNSGALLLAGQDISTGQLVRSVYPGVGVPVSNIHGFQSLERTETININEYPPIICFRRTYGYMLWANEDGTQFKITMLRLDSNETIAADSSTTQDITNIIQHFVGEYQLVTLLDGFFYLAGIQMINEQPYLVAYFLDYDYSNHSYEIIVSPDYIVWSDPLSIHSTFNVIESNISNCYFIIYTVPSNGIRAITLIPSEDNMVRQDGSDGLLIEDLDVLTDTKLYSTKDTYNFVWISYLNRVFVVRNAVEESYYYLQNPINVNIIDPIIGISAFNPYGTDYFNTSYALVFTQVPESNSYQLKNMFFSNESLPEITTLETLTNDNLPVPGSETIEYCKTFGDDTSMYLFFSSPGTGRTYLAGYSISLAQIEDSDSMINIGQEFISNQVFVPNSFIQQCHFFSDDFDGFFIPCVSSDDPTVFGIIPYYYDKYKRHDWIGVSFHTADKGNTVSVMLTGTVVHVIQTLEIGAVYYIRTTDDEWVTPLLDVDSGIPIGKAVGIHQLQLYSVYYH